MTHKAKNISKAKGKPKKNHVLKPIGFPSGKEPFQMAANIRLTPVPVKVLIPPIGAAYVTPRTTALQKLLIGVAALADPSVGFTGRRCRIPVATGIIITAQATLCIHMLTKAVVAQMPSKRKGGFTGSPQNRKVICNFQRHHHVLYIYFESKS